MWPGSFCSSGTCRCANNQPGFLTRDGTVCVNYGLCPTGGDSSVQYTLPQGCGTGVVTDVLCGELYDCVCTDSSCNNQGICCPSRGRLNRRRKGEAHSLFLQPSPACKRRIRARAAPASPHAIGSIPSHVNARRSPMRAVVAMVTTSRRSISARAIALTVRLNNDENVSKKCM